MYVLGFEADINGKRFQRLADVEVVASMKSLGTYATLKIPTTARLSRGDEFISEVETAKTFAVGDPISIYFGYNGNLVEEFRGTVRRIRPTTPVEIECEDQVFELKRKRLLKSFRNVSLEQVLNFILADTGIEVVNDPPEINFKTFYLKNVNAAQALEKIRKEYGLTIYFPQYGQLVVGLASETDGTIVKYTLGCNVVSHQLEWEDESDVSLKIKAIAVAKNNTRREAEVGDPDGDLRTLYFYDLGDDEDLSARAQEEILKYKYSGYRGSITGFLLPNCRPGNTARFKDENFDNREGDYLVEEVKTKLTTNGGRRTVKLGLKLD